MVRCGYTVALREEARKLLNGWIFEIAKNEFTVQADRPRHNGLPCHPQSQGLIFIRNYI
jgi:hypothetical protein